jgi:hypothetical protein
MNQKASEIFLNSGIEKLVVQELFEVKVLLSKD